MRIVCAQHLDHKVPIVVSMLARCPELSTVRYDPASGRVRYAFFVRGGLSADVYRRLRGRVDEALDAFIRLERRPLGHLDVRCEEHGEVSVLEVERDVEALSPEEMVLVVELVREACGERLLCDRSDSADGDGGDEEEAVLEQLIDDLRQARPNHRLIAFREEGRVVVFNT